MTNATEISSTLMESTNFITPMIYQCQPSADPLTHSPFIRYTAQFQCSRAGQLLCFQDFARKSFRFRDLSGFLFASC